MSSFKDLRIVDNFYDAIVNGVMASSFPKVPIDFGYRDSAYFWYTKFRRGFKCPIPNVQSNSLGSVRSAADRTDPNIHFNDEACAMLVKVPRVFLKTARNGCVKYAKEHGITTIDEKVMKDINDSRRPRKASGKPKRSEEPFGLLFFCLR